MATSRARSIKTNYRLSPNEEAALIKEEKAKRRKLRIQQVREQERNFASKIRSNVSKKKEEELQNLAAHLKQNWQREHKEKADALQRVYERSLGSVGDGHRAASTQPPLSEIRAAQSVKDQHAAKQRYSTALKKHQENKEAQYEKEFATILARKSALEVEKVRAAKIASLPPPLKDPIDELDDIGKENKVVTVISGFSTSHYHLKGEYVERAEPHEQEDARLAAQEESRRVKEEDEDAAREVKERHEKAHLRHQHARKQELLHQDYNKLMEELGHLEQADRRRRQAIVANIPHQVFQPPHKRLEDKLEEQQKLEQAFEDMYMANTDYTGDLILALEPKPKGDADLDVTMDSVTDDVGISLQPVPPEMSDDVESRFPRGIDEEARIPRRIHEEGRFPRGIDEEGRFPRGVDEEARIPRRIDEEGRFPRGIDEEARIPRGIDEEEEQEQEEEKIITEDEKPRQTRAPLKMLMNRIQPQREQMKKKKVVLEIPGQVVLPTEETKSHGRSGILQGPSSPSIEGSQTASESERSTIDTLETGTMSEDNNKDHEKMMREDVQDETLLHPMERAAKIREAVKMPDVELQKKTQQEIMVKEDSQRLRLAEQQLQDHKDHRDHLQLLQDNLLQRQLMLQQQIEEQERQHRQQLQSQQQDHVHQQAALWNKELQNKHEMVKRQIELDNQHRQQQQFAQQQAVLWKKELQKKQDMIKRQIEIDRERREQKQQLQSEESQEQYPPDTRPTLHEALQLHQQPNQYPHALTPNQQNLNQQQQDQHDVTHYHDLPENLLQNQNGTRAHQHSPKQHQIPAPLKEVNLLTHKEEEDLVSYDYQRTGPLKVQEVPKSFLQNAEKASSNFGSKMLPESRAVYRLPENIDSTSNPVPLATVHQGHSMEWQRVHGHDTQAIPAPDPAYRDQIQLPSRDTLKEAQRSLQQRRERLMQQYPELKLPPYDPYITDATSSGPMSHTPLTHPGVQTVRDKSNQSARDDVISKVDLNDNILRPSEPSAATVSTSISVADTFIGTGASEMQTGVSTISQGVSREPAGDMTKSMSSSLWTGAPGMPKGEVTTGDLSTPRTGVTTDGAVTYPPSANVAVSSIAKLPSGTSPPDDPSSKRLEPDHSPLGQMERQLEQHRQILLKTRQQLQQKQQQQQQRILDKQRVLAQRIEQQRQEQLTRHHTQIVMSHAQNLMTSSEGIPGIMTSPQDEVMSQRGIVKPGLMTSQALPQDMMTSHRGGIAFGTHGEMVQSSETHKDPQKTESRSLKQSQSISSDSDTAQAPVRDKNNSSSNATPYKLPSITFGDSMFRYRSPHGMSSESPQSFGEPPLFHELSPESSDNLTGDSEHHLEDVTSISQDDWTGLSGGTDTVQHDWKTILASHSAPPKPTPIQPHQPTLQSSRLLKHPRPPPAPLRLPQTLEDAAPHELSTIIEAESPGADRILRNYPPSSMTASTPHKTSHHADTQKETYAVTHPFLTDYSHLTEESSKISQTAFTVDEVISKYTEHLEDRPSHPQYHAVVPSTIPSFAEDIGQGVLSYPTSSTMSAGPVAPISVTPASASISTPNTSHIPTPSVVPVASPSTNIEGASPSADSQFSSSVSPLSEHTLRQTQNSSNNSLLSEGSIEKFLALSASEGTTSDSVSSTSARYQPHVVISEKQSLNSPIMKDFVSDVSSVSGLQDSKIVLPTSSYQPRRPDEPRASINTTETRQSTASQEYGLGPVSPQSTWTDADSQSGSYLNNEVPVIPMFRRDIPKDGMPMFSDISLSYGNTSFESGQSGLPSSATLLIKPQSSLPGGGDNVGFNSSVYPHGSSGQWFVPQHSLDASGFQQPGGDATPQQNPDDTNSRLDVDVESRTALGAEDDGKDDDSSKLSYAGALIEESHDAIVSSDDTLQEAMRNIQLSESETSKETGIIEEPDLTLISLNTTMTSSVAPDDGDINDEMKQRELESDNLGSDSLASFLHHEEELSLESPARTGSDRSGADGSGVSLDKDQVLLTSDTSQEGTTTLQDAFLRHKRSFIKSCHSRQQEVKVRSENQQATAFSQTLDNWKRSRGGKVQRSTKPRTAGSPSKGPTVKGQRSAIRRSSQETTSSLGQRAQTKDISKTVTASGRLSAEKEMYKRNVKLYNQLEEVQKQKLTKDRQKEYAANRQRRKEFEQKLQSRLSKLTKSSKPSS